MNLTQAMLGCAQMSSAAARIEQSAAKLADLRAAVEKALEGKPDVIDLALTALLAEGHVLIEDVPGVGKTTLARALARAVGGELHRVQFTSDLLPATCLASPYSTNEGETSSSDRDRSSPTCCWPTKSTAPVREHSQPCLRR